MKNTVIAGLILVFAVSGASWAGQCKGNTQKAAHSEMDIIGTAQSAGSFNTLVAAVKAAGLVEALQGKGPFTVFAPTDDAFAALPEGTVETLLKPENKDQLAAILTYHVVPSKLGSVAVSHRSGATTLNGQRLTFASDGHAVTVDNANVVSADIHTSNGVIHVIDKVVLPTDVNLVQQADKAGQFGTLLTAATKAGLAGVLSDEGPFTVFAPTDEAFAALPEGTVENLLKPENKDQLASILKYHVVSGRVFSDEAVQLGAAQTLQGQDVMIRKDGSGVRIEGAQVVMADINASNGVIHVIDQVILPN